MKALPPVDSQPEGCRWLSLLVACQLRCPAQPGKGYLSPQGPVYRKCQCLKWTVANNQPDPLPSSLVLNVDWGSYPLSSIFLQQIFKKGVQNHG